MVFLQDIIVSLYAAANVAKSMRLSWMSSPFSWSFFAPWYPGNLVENFAPFCIHNVPPESVPGSLPSFCWRGPYRPTCHINRKIVQYCTQQCTLCQQCRHCGFSFLHRFQTLECPELVVRFPEREDLRPTGQPTWSGSSQDPDILPDGTLQKYMQ